MGLRPHPAGDPLSYPRVGARHTADRRRRSITSANLGIALSSVVIVLVAAMLHRHLPADLGASPEPALLLAAALYAGKTLLNLAILRRPAVRRVDQLAGYADVALDLAAMATFFVTITPESRTMMAAVMVVPALNAAVRFGLPGAITTWACALGIYGAVTVQALVGDPSLSDHDIALQLFTLGTAGLASFLAAMTSGLQTRAVNHHLVLLEQTQAVLEHQATHDPLTGLANRSALYRRTTSWVGPGALLAVDLDGFKLVNDIYGHAVGDEVLRKVATRLAAGVRAEDLVVRTGGDEFVVLLAGADAEAARAVAATITAAIPQPLQTATARVTVGASVGVAVVTDDGPWDIDALCVEADTRMYQAKVFRKRADGQHPRLIDGTTRRSQPDQRTRSS